MKYRGKNPVTASITALSMILQVAYGHSGLQTFGALESS